ncbi:MAG: YggS family pyridoxal phosphate-dependent enzyme [Bacteroidales bacterium]|nr:YggS family pyridoxal phosphate-dependent enzyme [Bacteroidales bacterium]
MEIRGALNKLKLELPQRVKLIVVTKTQPVNIIQEAYNEGHKVFGENKVQELVSKYEVLPKDIEWHLIGHLQSNKVKYIAPFVNLIHGVDSIKLLRAIDSEGKKTDRIINCLIQVKIASEDTKFGMSESDLRYLLNSGSINELDNVSVRGLMGMATYTGDNNIIRAEFKKLYDIFKSVKENNFKNSPNFNQLSMGMSGDYKIAVEEGSTMIRIGSLIFGERIYN